MRSAIILGAALTLFAAVIAWRLQSRAPELPPPPPARPPAAAGLPQISAPELKNRLDSGGDLLLVFVGTEVFFQARRIPGARCVEYGGLRKTFQALDRDREIVLYCGCCGGASEGVSGLALRQLLAMGFRRARHLAGHYAAWKDAGYAVEGTDPVAEPGVDEAQRKMLDGFTQEADRRRGELDAALRTEPDPARKDELIGRLRELDRRIEIDALMLKRRLAADAGDSARVADVDRILQEKSGR